MFCSWRTLSIFCLDTQLLTSLIAVYYKTDFSLETFFSRTEIFVDCNLTLVDLTFKNIYFNTIKKTAGLRLSRIFSSNICICKLFLNSQTFDFPFLGEYSAIAKSFISHDIFTERGTCHQHMTFKRRF